MIDTYFYDELSLRILKTRRDLGPFSTKTERRCATFSPPLIFRFCDVTKLLS